MTQQQEQGTNYVRSTLAQCLVMIGMCVLCVNVGLITCMSTMVIGALRTENSSMVMSESEASWFGSLLFICQPIGSLTSGFSQDLFGWRLCLLLINIPQLIAWLIISFSSRVGHLYVAIAMCGLSLGFMEAPILSYIGETAQPRLRGVITCCATVFYNVGIMLETVLGVVLPWRAMALWSAISPVVGFIMMAMLPESPAWLVSKGRIQEAERAYQWVRGWTTREAVLQELEDMVAYVKDPLGTDQLQSGDNKPVATIEEMKHGKPRKGKFEFMLEPRVLKAFRIVLIYFTITVSASLYAMRPFFIEILYKLHLPITPDNMVVFCGVLQFLGSIVMCCSLKLLGKRGITFLSLGLSVFCCLGLGLYLASDLAFPWVPTFLFSLSYFAGSLGIIAIPWCLTIELFPLRARGMASGICGAFAYVALFLVTKTYYSLEAWVHLSGTCLLYGVIGVLGFVYLYLDMPETEGVTLEEIERRMSGRRSC